MPSHQSIFVSSKCDNISYTSFRVVRYSNKPAVNRPRTSKNCNIEVHIDLCKNVGNKTSAQSIDYSSKEREEEKNKLMFDGPKLSYGVCTVLILLIKICLIYTSPWCCQTFNRFRKKIPVFSIVSFSTFLPYDEIRIQANKRRQM